jgi:hypothetical protein
MMVSIVIQVFTIFLLTRTVNVINNTKPGAELFAPERIKWVAALQDAGQVDAMPS